MQTLEFLRLRLEDLVENMSVGRYPLLPLVMVLTGLAFCGLVLEYGTALVPCYLLGAGLVGLWILSKKLYGNLFSPFCIYLSTWLGGLLLFNLRLIDLYPLRTRTILLFASSLIAFASGCVSLIAFRRRSRSPGTMVENSTPSPQRRDIEMTLLAVTILDGIGLLLLPVQYRYLPGYFSTFFTPGGLMYMPLDYDRLVGNFPLLVVPLEGVYFLSSLLAVYYLVRFRHPSKLAFLSLALVLFRVSIVPNRAPMTALIFASCFVYLYVRKPKFNLRLLSTGVAVLVLVVAYFHFVGARLFKSVAYQEDIYYRDVRVSPQYSWLMDPYIYVSAPFAGFDAMVDHVRALTYGEETFYPLVQFANRLAGSPAKVSFTSYTFYYVPIPCNVYTFLGQFYTDFGWPGVLIFPFLLGLASTFCYSRMQKYGGPSATLGTAAFNAFFIFSIFTNFFVLVTVWEAFFLIFLVGLIVRQARSPQSATSCHGDSTDYFSGYHRESGKGYSCRA